MVEQDGWRSSSSTYIGATTHRVRDAVWRAESEKRGAKISPDTDWGAEIGTATFRLEQSGADSHRGRSGGAQRSGGTPSLPGQEGTSQTPAGGAETATVPHGAKTESGGQSALLRAIPMQILNNASTVLPSASPQRVAGERQGETELEGLRF